MVNHLFVYLALSRTFCIYYPSSCYSSSGGCELITLFFINNQKFKQSPRKSLICQTISKQFAGANKRRKLNNPLREQAKILFLHREPKRNAHFWTCQIYVLHTLGVPVINYDDFLSV